MYNDLKNWFFDVLKKTDLYYSFLSEFGDKKTEESCCAEYNYLEGWYFDEDTISYRCKDLFDDHADGYNWEFCTGGISWVLKQILLSHGFTVDFEGGDEEDGLFIMKKNK